MSNTVKTIKIELIFILLQVLLTSEIIKAVIDPKTGNVYYHSVLLKPIALRQHGGHSGIRSWYCGASLLNKHILLTAAHCVEFRDKPIEIGVLYENVCVATNITIGVYKIHENYNPETKANDIALLVTTIPIEYSSGSRIRKLLLFNHELPRQLSTAYGWQIIDHHHHHSHWKSTAGHGPPPKPKQSHLQDKTHNCSSSYIRFFQEKIKSRKCCRRYTDNVPTGTFCILLKENGQLLYNSAGVPVVIKDYIQIGITSFKELTKYGPLIVITNTTYFHHWITENSKLVYCIWVKRKCKCKGLQCKHLVVLMSNPLLSVKGVMAIRPPQ